MKNYVFHKELVVRTPMLPLLSELNRQTVEGLLENSLFMEAVYLASPVLYDECLKWKKGTLTQEKEIQKIIRSLVKYFTRMSTRCTPFGLFSGCSMVKWGPAGLIQFNPDGFKRHTRFDMHYLCALAEYLSCLPVIRQYLNYFPNNSFYRMGDEMRFVEYRQRLGKRRYQISSISATGFVIKVLQQARQGITITAIKDLLETSGAPIEDIDTYIDELITSQVIVSELEPSITGEEYIHKIIGILQRIYHESQDALTGKLLQALKTATAQLEQIDLSGQNEPAAYRNIAALLDQLGVPYEENKLFQTDTFKHPVQHLPLEPGATIDEKLQQQIAGALQVLNRLTLPAQENNLESFKKRFVARYEEKEVNLLEVLDTETGIGYIEHKNDEHAPFVEDIILTGAKERDARLRWGLIEKYLITKLNKAAETKSLTIELNPNELDHLGADNWNDLPASMSVMFRLVDDANSTLLLEHAGGSSAVNILGRFAHGDHHIDQYVRDIVGKEQQQEQEAIFAEIIHLPESRTGNVLLHPAFREYEIPYLCHSSLLPENQVPLSDLYISVKNNSLVLRSKRLNKIVIPRLSNAHNYKAHALPVYHFLCDMQAQHQRNGMSFNWGSLTFQHKFFPRVTYKNTILSAACWRLEKADFAPLEKGHPAGLYEAVNKFRTAWQLPRFAVLADGDNEMYIDFDNELIVQTFLEIIKKRTNIELKEFIFPSGHIINTETGDVYNNQFVATLIRTAPAQKRPASGQERQAEAPQRSFAIGSEWLYFKFYCGVKSADKILVKAIEPAVEYLLKRKLITQFFFIRYNDPSFHLRVRFRLTRPGCTGEVIRILHQYVAGFESQGFIWKTQTDTYTRELERYGASSIGLAEELFYHDSRSALQLFTLYNGDELENLKWTWTILSIDTLLNDFGLSIEERINLMEHLKKGYEQEFRSDRMLTDQINNKFRQNRDTISMVMRREEDELLKPVCKALESRSAGIKPVVEKLRELSLEGKLEHTMEHLLFSYIHMLVNRIISAKPRLHELVIYNFLYRYYRSVVFREKNQQYV